eukprot:gene27318-biopygen3153
MEKAHSYMVKNPEHAQWGLLLDSLCVVDADSDDAVAKIEALQDPDVVEALSVCPIQQTNKGRHYLFIRPEWADAEGYWDGARQVIGFDADLKTRCSTGTRGVLAICPSLNKTWVREPWAAGTKLVDIPRTLMELVAKPKQTKQKKQRSIKVVVNDDIDHESGAPEAFDEVAALVDIIAATRASSYRTWMEVGWCLHNISPTHLPLWELFSKKCPEKYTKGKCGEVWGTMNSDDRAGLRLRLRLGSLHMWARHDSPVEYWDIVSQRVIEDIRTCNGSHNEIARIAKKILGKRIASASTNGKICYALNLEARLTRVLEEAALLPSDLRTYSTTGFATDVERFKESLGEGFSCNVMGGTSEVPKRDLRAAIQHLLQPGTDVAVLLFCGHGTWSGSTQHGALVCSFGKQITAQEIEDIVAQQGFTGTFVRVLNMCEERFNATRI